MNSYITLAVLLLAGFSHANPVAPIGLGGLGYGLGGLGYGLGGLGGYGLSYGAPILSGPIIAPAAVSTANLYKAAPIPIVKTVIPAPVISPISTVPILKTVNVGGLGVNSLGLSGLGYGYGGLGYGYGGLGYGYGGLGYGYGKH